MYYPVTIIRTSSVKQVLELPLIFPRFWLLKFVPISATKGHQSLTNEFFSNMQLLKFSVLSESRCTFKLLLVPLFIGSVLYDVYHIFSGGKAAGAWR